MQGSIEPAAGIEAGFSNYMWAEQRRRGSSGNQDHQLGVERPRHIRGGHHPRNTKAYWQQSERIQTIKPNNLVHAKIQR